MNLNQNENINIKNIVFCLLGESHRDPAPSGLMRAYMEKFHSIGIPQIFCAELPCDQTLAQKIKFEKTCDQQNQMMMQIPGIKAIAKKNSALSFPYFDFNMEEQVQRVLQLTQIIPNESIPQAASQLTKYVANRENMLLNLQLHQLGIPFIGIERRTEEHANFYQNILVSQQSNELMRSAESIRMEGMLQKIVANVLPKIANSGGVIWISVGAIHTHNLAISILNYIQKNELSRQHSYTLIPIVSFSDYVLDTKKSLLEAVSQYKFNLRQEELLPLFEKLPYHLVDDIKELSQHKFESITFSNLMSYAEESFKKKNIFFIPSFNGDKKQLIEEKEGIIIGQENDYTIVSIASEVLLLPVRKQLEIERNKITFSKNYQENIEKLSCLAAVTLEHLPNPKQVIVTYPVSVKELVNEIVKGK